MANVLGELFGEIASAIRSKTGDDGKMKPAEFPEKIIAIDSISGADEYNAMLDEINGEVINGVVITFIGVDGSVLCELSVLPGKNCPNPVTTGHITKPTKESTVSTVYSFSGWSLTEGGEAVSNALNNVTENRTLYAAFTESVRYYTVRFWDGDTLRRTEQIPYNGSSTYVYDKTGYNFEGWNPQPVNVASDMDCYGTWTVSSFAGDSWDQIAENCENGVAAQHYKVGDERQIHVTYDKAYDGVAGADITLRVINIGKEKNYNGEYMNGMVILCATPLHMSKMAYKADFANKLGDILAYSVSDIMDHLDVSVHNILPSDLKRNITPTTRSCTSVFTGVNTTDKYDVLLNLWSLTYNEVGSSYDLLSYEYFKGDNAEKRILRLPGYPGDAVEWLLRDPYDGDEIYVVQKDGSIARKSPTYADAYAAFAFFIGG